MKALSRSFLLFSLVLLQSTVGFSGVYFNNLRNDQTIPADCRETEMRDFTHMPETFTLSIDGAKESGFDYEYPLSRRGGRLLWDALKNSNALGVLKKYSQKYEPELVGYYKLAKEYADKMGFDFGSEGEVLEILAVVKFYEKYDPKIYFVTGSVEYHPIGRSGAMGELDIVIGHRDTCEVIAVGEAKLGIRSKSKARSQMNRFKGFLSRVMSGKK